MLSIIPKKVKWVGLLASRPMAIKKPKVSKVKKKLTIKSKEEKGPGKPMSAENVVKASESKKPETSGSKKTETLMKVETVKPAQSDVHSPRIGPYEIGEPKVGATYFWCSCGDSKNQPFCDHSHLGTEFKPVEYTQTEYKYEVSFCGCKKTKTVPICDATCRKNAQKYTLAESDPLIKI